MNILFTICARAGSKGLPNKNLIDFLGKPLYTYTLSIISLYTKNYPQVNSVISVNTDSDELINRLSKFKGLEIIFVKRRSELALDDSAKIEVIRDTYREVKKIKKIDFDQVIDLDLTSPLRRLVDLELVVKKMQKTDKDLIFTVVKSRRNPRFNMIESKDGIYKRVIESNYVSRQQAPNVYDMNASIYSYSTKFLEKPISLFEADFDIVEMKDTHILDIDDKEDHFYMEVIAQKLFEKDYEFSEINENIKNLV